MNDAPMTLGMSLFLCVFLIPFVTIGAVLAFSALMNLIGRIEVVIDDLESHVSTGAWILNWKTLFNPREVSAVELGNRAWASNESDNQVIELVADRTVKIGGTLDTEKRRWLRAVLRQLFDLHTEPALHPSVPRPAWLQRQRSY